MTTRKGATSRAQQQQAQAEQLRQTRTQQLETVQQIMRSTQAHEDAVRGQLKQLALLESVSLGLYEEIDKLAKKAPAEPVTDLVLTQVNDIIRETRELIPDDLYIQRLREFVAAGDNPQHRDAVVVLRQIRQGLSRFHKQADGSLADIRQRLSRAHGIQVALQLFLEHGGAVRQDDLRRFGASVSNALIEGEYNGVFDFEQLDKLQLLDYLGGSAATDGANDS